MLMALPISGNSEMTIFFCFSKIENQTTTDKPNDNLLPKLIDKIQHFKSSLQFIYLQLYQPVIESEYGNIVNGQVPDKHGFWYQPSILFLQ